ncbi:hypothetical protein TNCV_3831581 [Trichonephila clavipes]|nr:hypothetical protein TNCV_3831581 [Trichonephila clavipes]
MIEDLPCRRGLVPWPQGDNLRDRFVPPLPTQGLLAMDLVILNPGQATRTTFELAPPSPNFHTPTLGHLSLDRFNVYRSPTRRVFSGSRFKLMIHESHESILTTRLLLPYLILDIDVE